MSNVVRLLIEVDVLPLQAQDLSLSHYRLQSYDYDKLFERSR